MNIYLDNAATTALHPQALDAMTPYLLNYYGNPSSTHSQGRHAKAALNDCRQRIAALLQAQPEEIVFTSGGTEADNIAIVSAVTCNRIDHVITTPFEHPAVLQTLRSLSRQHHTRLSFIRHDDKGNLDLKHLEYLLSTNTRNLVSIMHANNEIGNLNNIKTIGGLCKKYGALFHTDTVQTMGHYHINPEESGIDFLAASAHKFHGPKGTGFLYCRRGRQLSRIIHGGGQESGTRAGTENIPGIVGMTRALELSYAAIDKDSTHIAGLKNYLVKQLAEIIPEISFNGNSANPDKSLYTVLSVSLPASGINMLQYLDHENIAVSGGSACSGGAPSPVLKALGTDPSRTTIRFSFSRFNTFSEIDYVVETLAATYRLKSA